MKLMLSKSTMRLQAKDFLLLSLCVFLCFTQLKMLLPFIPTLLLMLAGAFFTVAYSKNYYLQKYFVWAVIYVIVLAFNHFSGDKYFDNINNVVEETCVLLVPAALSYYIITNKKLKLAKWLLFSFMLLIIYSSIATFLAVQIIPDAVRYSVYLLNIGDTQTINLLYGMGMVTYRFPHAIPAFIPVLVYIIKSKGGYKRQRWKMQLRWFALISLLSLLLLVYLSNATTALLVSMLSLILSFFILGKDNKYNVPLVMVIAVLFLPFVIYSDWLVSLLNGVGSFLGQDTSFTNRFDDIRFYSQTGNAAGDLAGRFNKYNISISYFLERPLIGSDKAPGGHSAVIDRLASLGLVGWIPYILFVFAMIKKQRRLLSMQVASYYFVGVASALLILFSKNMSNWDTWFFAFCLLPVGLWVANIDFNKTVE